jgi:hypothetical protein
LSRLAIGATSSTQRHRRLISVDEGMTSSVASQLPAGVKREHRGWFDMGGVPFHDIEQHVVFLRIALEEWPVLAATPII